jgi:hypothetical protein
MRPPTSRYQSQFLTFLNQQTQRLKDQTGLMWRHLKLATVWGSQIVLYPIYALFQATRMANRQLRQAAYRALALLLPATESSRSEQPLAQQDMLTIPDRPHLIAPVRFFYQLMAWVQQGDIAHQLNLFSETAIVAQPSADWFRPQLGQLPGDGMVLKSADAIDWEHVLGNLTSMAGVSSLIRSAVHHFFGHHQPAITAAPKPTELADPWESEAVEITVETVEPTLTDSIPAENFVTGEFVDLHTIETTILASAAATIAASLPIVSETFALPSRSFKQKLAGLVKQVRGRISQPQTAPVPTIASLPQAPTAANLTWQNVFSSDPTTTWIETVAEPVGYIQHPLERLLGWVDRGFVWIETLIRRLWQQCKNLWQSVANR